MEAAEYRGWVALRPLRDGDRTIAPGTPLPQAEDWPLRDQMFSTHQIGWEGGGEPPRRWLRPPGLAFMAVHDRLVADAQRSRKGVAA